MSQYLVSLFVVAVTILKISDVLLQLYLVPFCSRCYQFFVL